MHDTPIDLSSSFSKKVWSSSVCLLFLGCAQVDPHFFTKKFRFIRRLLRFQKNYGDLPPVFQTKDIILTHMLQVLLSPTLLLSSLGVSVYVDPHNFSETPVIALEIKRYFFCKKVGIYLCTPQDAYLRASSITYLRASSRHFFLSVLFCCVTRITHSNIL